MSVTYHHKVQQGTDEWLELRRGIVTASTVGTLITPSTVKPANNDKSRGLIATLLAERITGRVEESYTSQDMLRGIMDEPIARDYYSEHIAPVAECGFVTFGPDGRSPIFGYSPDGLVGDDGLIEIKSRSPRTHIQTILSNEVPSMYMAQLQAGLYVTGREWIDFISFSSGLPLFVQRVTPDKRWFMAIGTAVGNAENAIRDALHAYKEAIDGLIPTEYIDHFGSDEIR